MRLTRPLAVLVSAIGLSGWSATGVGTTTQSVIQPAPPPATCRASPAGGWPLIEAVAPVPDLRSTQDYREGLGLDPTLTGAGVTIADVEYEWNSGHVELAARPLKPSVTPFGLDASYYTYPARDHGTAVLGILGADDDAHGITGLAPGAALLPVTPFFPAAAGLSAYEPAKAITDAGAGLVAGDVLLIELQANLSLPPLIEQLAPIEYYPVVRNAIRSVVNKGIVVVEPAGNGGLPIGSLPEVPVWLSDPNSGLHSGALIVGAGGSQFGSSSVGDRERVPGSNYGSRVDVQGYGAGVVTSGYDDLAIGAGADRRYTACFDGTSSAAATVAGAVAALQAKAKALYGVPLTPAQVRKLLVDSGLPQVPSVGDNPAAPKSIGPRPQIAAAIAKLTGAPYPPPPPAADPPVVTPPVTSAPTTIATPAPFITGPPIRLTTKAAVRGVSVRFDRSTGRVTIRLRGVAPSATVRVGTRRARFDHGRIVLTNVTPGRLVLRVSAAMSGTRIYRPVAFAITVPVHGAVRVARL